MIKKNILSRLKNIKLFATDVDGVMTDSGMYYSSDGVESKKFNVRDGMGLVLLQQAGIATAIITSEDTAIVVNRAKKLQIKNLFQGCKNKVEAMESLLKKYSLTWNEVAFIGDDVNDLELLSRVGFAATPADGTIKNKKLARYITKKKGGEGCVRELCDMLLEISEKKKK